MNRNSRFVGVITQLVEKKYEDGNPYKLAKIESPSYPFNISFHQKNLLFKTEIDSLANGKLVVFEISENKLGNGNLIAIKCILDCEKELEENIVSYSEEIINLILSKVSEETAKRFKLKIGNKKLDNKAPGVALKKIVLPPVVNKEGNMSMLNGSIPDLKRKPEHALLWKIFDDNTPEYNIKLLATLSEGIKQIDGEQIYNQAIMFLQLNAVMGEKKIPDLNFIFYSKSSKDYQFLFWLDGYVDFCPAASLGEYFKGATAEVKEQIRLRLGFTQDDTFLEGPSKQGHDRGIEILFANIREKILQELNSATISIRAAIAWFTNHELFEMLCFKLQQKVSVELIIVNDYINNWEFGLDFQKFIDLGGKLYLSEYPGLMHHKFCIIDDSVLINGSYNWTYYAEWFNKENIMLFRENQSAIERFNVEFDSIILALGVPIVELKRFEENEIKHFERRAYTEYISADLTLKADQIKPKNAQLASQVTAKAIMMDPRNNSAIVLERELEGLVRLEKSGRIVLETLNAAVHEEEVLDVSNPELDDVDDKIIDSEIKDQMIRSEANGTVVKDEISAEKPVNESVSVPKPEATDIVEKSPISPVEEIQKEVVSTVKATPASMVSAKVITGASMSQSLSTQNKTSISNNNIISSANIYSYAIPESETKAEGFEDLQVGIALDTSGSMENLYKNGTVQNVVERLLALAIAISQDGNLDVWTFDDSTRRQETVNKSNFRNYVNRKGFKGDGGTYAFKVVNAISEHYLSRDSFKKPVFAIILTDGDVGDLKSKITASLAYPIFWQFVGLGTSIASLEKLNKEHTNMTYFSLNDIETIGEEELYAKLLSEFPAWFKGLTAGK